MRKCGKFLLLAILAIVLIATLVACNFNESSQSGGGTGTGGGQGTGGGNVPVAETKPYGLEFEVLKGSSAFDKAVVSEFDLSRDVLAYITMQTGTERPVRGQQITLTEDMVAAEDRANLHKAYSGQIAVSYDYEGTTLTGKFTIHLQARKRPRDREHRHHGRILCGQQRTAHGHSGRVDVQCGHRHRVHL